MKFRAMSFRTAAPKRQPKSGRGEIRAMPGQVSRQIHAPKQGRDEVSGNEFPPSRAEATTEIKSR